MTKINILLVLAGVCKAITDHLSVWGRGVDSWWSSGVRWAWAEQFAWPINEWAYVIADGWHFFDAVRTLLYALAIWVALRSYRGKMIFGETVKFRLFPWWWVPILWTVHQVSYYVSQWAIHAVWGQ